MDFTVVRGRISERNKPESILKIRLEIKLGDISPFQIETDSNFENIPRRYMFANKIAVQNIPLPADYQIFGFCFVIRLVYSLINIAGKAFSSCKTPG